MNVLFKTGKKIIEKLNENNYEAFFVGGCVRDFYMNRAIQDVDITTNAKPEEVESIFKKTINVGKEHGTVIVMIDGISFEVTTYRTDGTYSNHRHPDEVIFSNHLNEDLKRRDFTMNAMAMYYDFIFHDPYSGRESIENHEISTVGHAADRFNEDALRMIRALRFMSVLDFTIEDRTEEAIVLNAHLLKHVSIERIVTELKKMYNGTALEQSKEKLVQTGLIFHIPFFTDTKSESFLKSRVNDFLDEVIVQVINNHFLSSRLNHLKLSNNEVKTVKSCISLYNALNDGEHSLNIAYSFSGHIIDRFMAINNDNFITEHIPALEKAKSLQPSLPIRSKKDLEVNGKHLMEMYNAGSGPWIKECLNVIEKKVLFGRLKNDHDHIIKWVERHVKVESGSIKIIE